MEGSFRKRSDKIRFEGYFLPNVYAILIYLGGNSNIFYFHPKPWGSMIQFDVHIFQMGWFNHQPDYCHITTPTHLCFPQKRPYLKPESPFPRPIILGIHVSFRVRVGLEGPSNHLRKVTQEQLHVLEQFLAADLPAWGSQGVVPHDAGGWKPTANDAIFNGISGEVSFNRDT